MKALIAILILAQILGMLWSWRVITIESDEMPLWWRAVLIVCWPLTGFLHLIGNVE